MRTSPVLPYPAADDPGQASITALEALLQARDSQTYRHSQRVAQYAVALGRQLGLTAGELITLEQGARLHDFGKVCIAASIVKKPGPLSGAEWTEMRRHPLLGYSRVSPFPFLTEAARIVLLHHERFDCAHRERFDGTGYPHGLAGTDIPLSVRVFSVVDAFDAMISPDRPYRCPVTINEACEHIRSGAGTHFDPQVVVAYAAVPRSEWHRLQSAVEPLWSATRPALPEPWQRAGRC